MKCWKCKHEMPDGVKYCGNCGVHLNRGIHYLQLLVSRKGLPVLLCLLAILIGLGVWGYLGSRVSPPSFDENMGGYVLDPGSVVFYDDSQNYGYVSNMLLVYFRKDATDSQIEEVVRKLDGEVVGILPGLRQYQIRISARSEEELNQLRLELMTLDAVKNVVIDYVSTVETEAVIPNDPWQDGYGSDNSWDEENPAGTNWWVEAVKLLSAWEYQDRLTSVNVGVADNGFDTAHEDLNLTLLNPDVADVQEHGTHVAGIVGATGNNHTGITGVVQNGEICCADVFPDEGLTSTSQIINGVNLCVYNDCRVVNMSVGTVYESAARDPDTTKYSARQAVENLIMLLDTYGENFLIVQSAGNGDGNHIGVDSGKYNGHYASITREIVEEKLNTMQAEGVKLDNTVTVDDVMNAFIIVGAVDSQRNGDQYQLATFSNYGDAVTVCAPGVSILSTLPGSTYGYKDGTSMAAPIVTGITAMTWAAAPELTAEEVKDLIVTTATETVLPRVAGDTGIYRMIDAKAAVEAALNVKSHFPSIEELFDHTYWDLYYGQSLGFQFTARFYPDGTFTSYSHGTGTLESGNYTYDEDTGKMTVSFRSWIDDFTYQDGEFQSLLLYEMQVGEEYRTITPSQLTQEQLEKMFGTSPDEGDRDKTDYRPPELLGTWKAYARSDSGEDTTWFLLLEEDGYAAVAWGEPNGEFTEYMPCFWYADARGNGEYYLYMGNNETGQKGELMCRKLGAELWLENGYGFEEEFVAQSWYERDLDYETWLQRLDYYGTDANQAKCWYAMANNSFQGGDILEVTLWSPLMNLEEWERCTETVQVVHFQAKWKNQMYEATNDMFLENWSVDEYGDAVFTGYNEKYVIDSNGSIFHTGSSWGGDVEYGDFVALQYGVTRKVRISEDCVVLDARNTGIASESDWQTLQDYFAREEEYPLSYVTLTFTAHWDGLYITEIEIPYFP